MPLDPDGLEDDIEAIFAAPGSTSENAAAWAAAMESYASGILPASAAVSAAASTLEAALAAAFVVPLGAAPLMEAAFAAFAVTVGGGMAGFVPTPPPSPVGFATLAPELPETAAEGAAAWAPLIHSWLTTGTSTPSVGGSPVTWS
jgi:hypothetical protein